MDTASNLYRAGQFTRLLGWLSLLGTVVIIAVVAMLYSESADIANELPLYAAALLLSMVVAIFTLFTGTALKDRRIWARNTAVALSLLALAAPPISTIIGIIILFYLYRGWSECA